MALRGTLKDFGIADIFQLIGQQMKTGTLTVRRREQEVRIHFHKGNVVGAESRNRQEREMLGTMLVRAEVITREQLETTLEQQKQTLKKLGRLLIDAHLLDAKTLTEFTRLQTTETVYRLFLWESGTYEFEQKDVSEVEDADTLRSENLLMEGFRQADEWPRIRQTISSYASRFEVLEDLEAMRHGTEQSSEESETDFGFDDLKDIGHNERLVYQLVQPERDVQKLIDLSRLGEFETCKALAMLVESNIIKRLESREKKASARPMVGGIDSGPRPGRVALALTLLFILAGGGGLFWLGRNVMDAPWLSRKEDIENPFGQRHALLGLLSRMQGQRIAHALAVYQAEEGHFPSALSTLKDAELLGERDMSFPWRDTFLYELEEDGKAYGLYRPVR